MMILKVINAIYGWIFDDGWAAKALQDLKHHLYERLGFTY